MARENCIIIGASHAAAQVAPNLRKDGWDGGISVMGNEYFLPYHRPPLSKAFLTGDKSFDNILIRQPAIYQSTSIRFTLGVQVTGIDRENKQLELDDHEIVPYDKLVLAAGARVRKIPVPGADLQGVFYMREINDVQQIKRYTGTGKKAVIVGGGYIGLETAASLRILGMDVTVIEALPRVMQRVTAPELSSFFTRIHTEEGVNIVTGVGVERFEGEKEVKSVVCGNGDVYDADLVVVGIGIVPNTDLAEAAGLEVNNGIVVDEYCRTSDQDILAAGDCTMHYNPIYDRHIRLESVQNAVDQASVVASTICGDLKPYNALPWFWSDQFDLKLQIAGLSEGYDQVVVRGDIHSGRSLSAFYLKEGRIIAVDAINKPQDFMLGKRFITEKIAVDQDRLADENAPLKELLNN